MPWGVYSGLNGDVTKALIASLLVTSLIQQLESLFYDSKQQGMMVAIRIMLYYQRSVGLYHRKVALR
jgi:hypothetical protein